MAAVLARSSGEERHRQAIEQASRRWRGGRRGDSRRTRRKILISTQVRAGFYRFSMDTPAIYRCKRNEGCASGNSSGTALCAKHHRGPLCQLCDDGYYLEPVLRRCKPVSYTHLTLPTIYSV